MKSKALSKSLQAREGPDEPSDTDLLLTPHTIVIATTTDHPMPTLLITHRSCQALVARKGVFDPESVSDHLRMMVHVPDMV